jgi:hypothetical protein
MPSIVAPAAHRALLRPLMLFFFVLLSWFAAPHAYAGMCDSRYGAAGAYPPPHRDLKLPDHFIAGNSTSR